MTYIRFAEWRVRAQSAPWSQTIEFWLFERQSIGEVQLTGEKEYAIGFNPLVDDGNRIPATFCLKPNESQVLMDDLWNAGMRPSEILSPVTAEAPLKEHLKDMRSIAMRYVDKTFEKE